MAETTAIGPRDDVAFKVLRDGSPIGHVLISIFFLSNALENFVYMGCQSL